MFTIRTYMLAAAITLSASVASAQVKLDFAWPDGLQATVTQTKSRLRSGATTPSSMTMSYDMKATKSPAGTVISFTNVRLDPSAAPSGQSDIQGKQLQLFAQAALPTYVVKQSGEFSGIEDVAAFKDTLRGALKQMLPALADDPKLRRALEQVTSEEFLTAAVQSDWNRYVGFWLGATLDVGDTYTLEYQGSIPLLPGRSIKMKAEFKVAKELPCTRAGQARKCVELEMRTTPDPADVAAAIDALIGQLAPSTGKLAEVMESIKVEENFRLVTEAEGLIPHQLSTHKRVLVSMQLGDAKKSMSDVQDSSVTFAYR